MSDLVAQYFPDAPEQCQTCPGLEAAASRLDFYFSVMRETSTPLENPENPLVSGENYLRSMTPDAQERLANRARHITDMTTEQFATITGIAEQLYTACEDGVSDDSEIQDKVITILRQCRSAAPVATFVPVMYSQNRLKDLS